MKTLLLDHTYWDLAIDANGNLAMASGAYALAQDAASAIRLFKGEYWYDTTIGIPYFQQILGENPPLELIRAQLQDAALSVPGVTTAVVYFSAFSGGQLSGQVQISDINGNTSLAGF